MNWYKKSQNIISEPEMEERPMRYTEIGHEGYNRGYDKENIMWVYINGRIETCEESCDFPTHGEAFYENFGEEEIEDRFYTGRYEPDTGNLSIYIPISQRTYRARKEVPSFLLRKLRSKFPNIQNIYIFT